jgi:hypothetical protein
MPCELYQDALVEAAAFGIEPQGELRAHLAACTVCRTAFAQEQSLFSSIDTGLHAAANAEVPASLLPRVRARLVEVTAPRRMWAPSWLAMAGAAAMVVALLAARAAWHPGVEQTPLNTVSSKNNPAPVIPQPQNQNSSAAPSAIKNLNSHPRATPTKTPFHPGSPAKREALPEVLVPRDQEVLLVSYAEQWSQRKHAPLVAANFDATILSPLQIAPIQIAQLDVKLMTEEQAQ